MIDHAPSATVQGKELIKPSSTSYDPSDGTDIETTAPSVPRSQSRMWSMVALAADATRWKGRAP